MTFGYRTVFIGDSEVGKTSIINRFIKNDFTDQNATVGATFFSQIINFENKQIPIQIWDTAGQEKYRAIGPIYYRKSVAAVAVFDLTRRETFENLKTWINDYRNYADDGFVVVVGNKQDLDDKIVFDLDETMQWAYSMNAECVWSSAKTGIGIDVIFNLLGSHLSKVITADEKTENVVIPQEQCNPPQSESCC